MDMKTVLVLNQKGGVGKTLIADEIAFALERAGVSFNFYDLDGQGGCLHTDYPEKDDAAYCVVDTPGALQKDMAKWMKEADVIVIPTRMTAKEIEPLERMIEMVKANDIKVPVLYVLNCRNSYKACADFEEWFKEQHPDLKTIVIPQSELFVQASAEGKSVVEYKKNSVPAEKIKVLTGLIKYELGIMQ